MNESVLSVLAAQPPATLALVGGERSWTSAEVLAEVDALAVRLESAKVVAVLADNGPAWVIADLASLQAGKVHLPLPGFFSPTQMAFVLDQTAADTVLTDQPERIGALDLGFSITCSWQGLTCMRRVIAPVAIPAGTAKISFTSGSTGTPKGVCLSGRGLTDTAWAVHERLADLPITRHLAVLPLALLLENVAGVYAPLLRGAAIHLPPLQAIGWRGMAGFDPAALQATVAAVQPGSLILVPELLKAWSLFLGLAGQRAPEGLSFVAVGGARVDAALLARARALGLPAYQGYGLTECGSVVSLNRPGDDGDDVGRPLGHVQIAVADGEVQVAARAFLGYLGGEPAAGGPFPTGDLGEFAGNGHLKLAGRRKHLLITSFGRNISPEWVESVLLAQPALAQAVVVGDARPALAAIVVPLPGAGNAEVAAAIAAANAALPDYARIGHWLATQPFTLANGLATGNGRPVRQAINQQFAAEISAFYDQEEPLNAVL